jgi:N-acyl-D-aspartate/D-glutamate deacylase
MRYSTLIRGGVVYDGRGGDGVRTDLAISGDVISAVGDLAQADAHQTIDATGKIVLPGLIEVHTHYDPQMCWDAFATPSPEQGVTTVITGNCSISLAPVASEGPDRITRLFARIEDLRRDFFDAAVPYAWRSFPEYLDWLRPRLELNVGAMVGHTILRHAVMGKDAQQRSATAAEVDRMCGLLADALSAGAFGLSTAYDHIHDDHDAPVGCALADLSERVALAKVIGNAGRGFYQCNVNPLDVTKRLRQFQELAHIAGTAEIVCSALGVMENPIFPGSWSEELALLETLNRETNGRLCAETQVRPLDMKFRLAGGWIGAFYMPHWAPLIVAPLERRKAQFKDPSLRPALRADVNPYAGVVGRIRISQTRSAANGPFVGRTLDEIASAQGKHIADVLVDISLQDDLETVFDWAGVFHADDAAVCALLQHRHIMLGGSDAGAHVEQFSGAGDGLYLLSRLVRDLNLISMGKAVSLLTGDIATRLGIKGRGFLRPGYFADLVVADLGELSRGDEFLAHDLPNGGARYLRHSKGVAFTFVNGQMIWNGSANVTQRTGRLI